ncbi:MAG TPA: hypothetical protein VGI54_04520 [Solirubrobacteraceae bacterium]|jgi:hypothetical protein
MIVRAALALVAVLVVAWLGIMLRDARLAAAGEAATAGRPTAAVAARADRDLRHARLLNPDTDPLLYRVLLAQERGDLHGALRLALDVAHREPENFRAWSGVASAAERLDPRLVAKAEAAMDRLNPLGAHGR